MENKKEVVIIGAGFAGLNAAKVLGGKKELNVHLIDRRNHHLFQPLLYQVALAGLSPADIAMPIRQILSRYDNIHVVLGHADNIDLQNQTVTADERVYPYNYLVVACGASHSYFGKDEWEDFAPGIKTLEQATEIRRRILLAYEQAELKFKDQEEQRRKLTFVVVGGGPTGVELAGAIAEMSRKTLVSDFDFIDSSRTRIFLVEAGDRILPAFPEDLSKRAATDLEKMGVSIWTNAKVTNISREGVQVGSDFITSENVIWAAGVAPAELGSTLQVDKDRSGRIKVGDDLSLNNHKNVFVIGDGASVDNGKGGSLPGLAPVAMQQGRFVGKCILNDLNGHARGAFKYIDKGMMATIGKRRAVVAVGSLHFSGVLAWVAWLLIHIYYLIGFKNKVFVLINWAFSYFTNRKSARLILSKDWKEKF